MMYKCTSVLNPDPDPYKKCHGSPTLVLYLVFVLRCFGSGFIEKMDPDPVKPKTSYSTKISCTYSLSMVLSSVGDSDPQDPHVFRPPGPGSIVQTSEVWIWIRVLFHFLTKVLS